MERDRFDDMIVDIDSRLFDVQILISRFATDLLEQWPGKMMDIDIVLPVAGIESMCIVQMKSVTLSEDGGYMPVFTDLNDRKILWEELDVASQYLAVNHIHRAYVSKKLGERFNRSGQ